jgi:hypothetical protein
MAHLHGLADIRCADGGVSGRADRLDIDLLFLNGAALDA